MGYFISVTLSAHTQNCFPLGGPTVQCCGCKRPPISCSGSEPGKEEVCVWVRINCDNSNGNREVTYAHYI